MSEFELYETHEDYEEAEEAGIKLITDFIDKATADGLLGDGADAYALARRVDDCIADGSGDDDGLISEFVSNTQEWQRKYQSVGADDTASRQAFATSVVERIQEH